VSTPDFGLVEWAEYLFSVSDSEAYGVDKPEVEWVDFFLERRKGIRPPNFLGDACKSGIWSSDEGRAAVDEFLVSVVRAELLE
jgi:hypothetical protein